MSDGSAVAESVELVFSTGFHFEVENSLTTASIMFAFVSLFSFSVGICSSFSPSVRDFGEFCF
jgi:hypothetical protein